MQLDIFLDNRDTVLANRVIEGLVAHDPQRAQAAIDDLRREYPEHPALESFGRIEAYLRWITTDDAFPSVADEWDHLESEVVPATAALGDKSTVFLRPRWRRLASANRLFDANTPHLHPTALYLRAGDWSAAEAAASTVPNYERSAQAHCWLALAKYPRVGLKDALPHVFQVAWLAPERLKGLVDELGDPSLARARRDFLASLGELDDDWLPAWYLTEHPGMPFDGPLPACPSANAFGLTKRILTLEKQGHSPALVAKRARLKEIDETFFAWYMGRRRVSKR